KLLQSLGERADNRTVAIAAREGQAGAVAELRKGGADIEAVNPQGLTPLMLAAREGQDEVVRVLLDSGARINAVDREGLSALHQAAKEGHAGTVKLLLDRFFL